MHPVPNLGSNDGSLPAAAGESPRGGLGLRPQIAESWRRSSLCGVSPDSGSSELPYDTGFDDDSRLMRAARPVLERLITTLAHTPTSVILADSEARILERWVGDGSLYNAMDKAHAAPGFMFAEEFAGTNGLGTVLEESSIVEVRGEEHFAGFLRHLACVGVPIHNPLTRKVQGVLDITCLQQDHNPLMAPLLVEAVRHIETRLTQMSSPHEVALLEEFVRTCRRYPGATVGVSPGLILTNPAAAEYLVPFDHPVLWDYASKLVASGRLEGVVELAKGRCTIRCTPVEGGSRTSPGVVVRLDFAPPRRNRIRQWSSPPGAPLAQPLPGRSPQWRQVVSRIAGMADLRQPVLVTGEAGVGKLHLARHLHHLHSLTQPGSVVRTVDASAASDDAAAHIAQSARTAWSEGCTLIVRRAECLPASAIDELFAAAENHNGTSRSPARLILTARSPSTTSGSDAAGDELVAYCSERLWVPPLSQRAEDIADLVPALLAEELEHPQARCSMPALQALLRCRWPGNVSELKEALSAALRTSGGQEIQPQHLPEWVLKRSTHRQLSALEVSERNIIIQTLASVDNNRTEAARILGIGRATLYRRMRCLGIPTCQELTR